MSEYELPNVLRLHNDIRQIEQETEVRIGALQEQIADEREKFAFLYDLVRSTDEQLVQAVKQTFEFLGFQNVVDVDKEKESTGNARIKREDLRIEDTSPLLLVETKGVNGLPREAASLQSWKYVAPRMRELQRTDIQALSIINHQRNLPPLERQNESPFGGDVLTNAELHGFGLMTAWDLFRLARGVATHRWKHQFVKGLFYKVGRIEPIPTHYEYIGRVEGFAEKAGAVGIRLEKTLRQGEKIAFELPVDFVEQLVETFQSERIPIKEASAGAHVGTGTKLTKQQAKIGVRVFRVSA